MSSSGLPQADDDDVRVQVSRKLASGIHLVECTSPYKTLIYGVLNTIFMSRVLPFIVSLQIYIISCHFN